MYPALAGNINAAALLRAEGEIRSSPKSPFRYLVVPSCSWAVRWGADFPMCHVSKQSSHPSFPKKDVSYMLLHVQGWTVGSYCFYLGVGWAGLCKAAAEFVSCPSPAHNSKILGVQVDAVIFPPSFFSFPPLRRIAVEIVYVFCQIQSLSYTEQSKNNFRILGLVQSPEIVGRV